MLTSLWSTIISPSASSSATQTSVTAAAFANWPSATQVNYLKANGSGTPPFLVVGTGADQRLATLTAGQDMVRLTPLPSNVSAAPGSLAPSAFQTWSGDIQAYYVRRTGSGTPPSVSIGNAATAIVATLGSDGFAVTLSASAALAASERSLTTAPPIDQPGQFLASILSPSAFFSLTPDQQAAYFNNLRINAAVITSTGLDINATITSFGFDIASHRLILPGGDASHTITTTINGATWQIGVPASAYPGFFNPTTLSISNVSPQTFASWPPAVQTAYVQRASGAAGQYPQAIVLGAQAFGFGAGGSSDGVTVLVSSAGAAAETVTNPAGFAADIFDAGPSPDDFLTWPYASQFALATIKAAAGVSPFTLGTSPNTMTVTATTTGSGFTLAATSDLLQASPAAIDPVLFADLMTPAQQAAYVGQFGAGTPKSLIVGSGGGALIATAPAGGTATVETAPSNFATDPSTLLPSDFMAWSATARQAYVAINVGTAASLAIGPAATSTTPANQITASLGSDGRLQILTQGQLSTTGQVDNTLPYINLPGAAGGAGSTVDQSVAYGLFPLLQGDPSQPGSTVTPLPDGFSLPPDQLDAGTFGGWNTAVQLQYIRQNSGGGASLDIGVSGSATGTIDVFISAPTVPQTTVQKVYTVQNLQKQDIAKMAYADQATLAGLPAFQAIAGSLGLYPDGTTTTSAASALALVQSQIITPALTMITDPTHANPPLPDGGMPAADQKVFTDEINLIATQLKTSAVFSPKDIQNAVSAITTRFQRANAFATAGVTNSLGALTLDSIFGQESHHASSSGFDSAYPSLFVTNTTSDIDDNKYWLTESHNTYTYNGTVYATSQSMINQLIIDQNIDLSDGQPHILNLQGVTIKNGDVQDQGSMTLTPTSILLQKRPSTSFASPTDDGWNDFHTADSQPGDIQYQVLTVKGSYTSYNKGGSTNVVYQKLDGSGEGQDFVSTILGTGAGTANSFWMKGDGGASLLAWMRTNVPNLGSLLADGKPHSVDLPNGGFTYTRDDDPTVRFTVTSVTLHGGGADTNASAKQGYTTFMTQEQTILDLANRAQSLATTGKVTSQNLDVPNLVFLFQLYTNLTGEAIIRDDTEEVNQTNALLQQYAVMQKIINQTVASFNPSQSDQQNPIKGSNPDGSFTAEEQAALSMFSNNPAAALSPIELLKGITRPTRDLTSGTGQYSQYWSTYGTELSDSVTLINQDSQVKMNDINSETKQKDRNFDLANNALSKMSDVIQKIATTID